MKRRRRASAAKSSRTSGDFDERSARKKHAFRRRQVSVMSRIGRMPIEVPDGVTVSVDPGRVSVKGPKGELTTQVSRDMKITEGEGGTLTVERPTDRGEHRALHGLT